MRVLVGAAVIAVTAAAALRPAAAGPAFADITWMSISNIYAEMGAVRLVIDGYITRLPQEAFYGGGGGYAHTRRTFTPDVPAVTRVFNALGGKGSIDLLLTGHSHWDHSFDTAVWAGLSGARIIGSRTTCFQAEAQAIAKDRCQVIDGGEVLTLGDGVTMHVVRWNHSGDSKVNPEQHDPVELAAVPAVDPTSGGLRAGVAEDFPNGGGNRAFLFVLDGPAGRFSWFFNNSASAVDLTLPIVVDGRNFGAPLDNLRSAMKAARLDAVDLWVGSGGAAVAQLVVPVLKPRRFLPVHWDGLWSPFAAGVPAAYADAGMAAFLDQQKIALTVPRQYMDKWRLTPRSFSVRPNDDVKKALGFSN